MKWYHRLLLHYWRWRVDHGGTDIARTELMRLEELARIERVLREFERRARGMQ